MCTLAVSDSSWPELLVLQIVMFLVAAGCPAGDMRCHWHNQHLGLKTQMAGARSCIPLSTILPRTSGPNTCTIRVRAPSALCQKYSYPVLG
jgi:hypothetical protein